MKEVMAVASTLSLKDVQRCFDKERRSFLRDLETLRQQLLKKDQSAARAAAAASAHTIQLKREIAALQSSLAAATAERTKFHDQYIHTSALLETALDQRQEDQVKLTSLNEKLRTIAKKHEVTIELVKNEAAANVRATQEERQALRARVEHLRGKLMTERKEWQNLHHPMVDEVQKSTTRLKLVEKELQDARYRERSSVQLKEKMEREVTMFQRKVEELSMALQDAVHSKSELKSEHSAMMRQMKNKWRDVVHQHHHSREQLLMLQEDYNGLFRLKLWIEEQNKEIYQSMKQMKDWHERMIKVKEEELWEMEKHYKKMSSTCKQCLKNPEQKEHDEKIKLDAVREQTRLEVMKELELERRDRYQDVNTKYLDTCKKLEHAVKECEVLRGKCEALTNQYQELEEKSKRLSAMLEQSESKVREINAIHDEDTLQIEETKTTMQGLIQNLTSLTAVTADQSKKLQEVEITHQAQRKNLIDRIHSLEADKKQIEHEHEQLKHRYDEFVAQYEILKQEKSKHWNQIVEAQLSANLLIEEQAHTIDDLLQAKADGCATPTSSNQSPCCKRTPSAHKLRTFVTPDNDTCVLSLRKECDALRKEVSQLNTKLKDEKHRLHTNESELMQQLQLERQRLKKKIEEQALTIHELTLQEEDEEDDNERLIQSEDCAHNGEQMSGSQGVFSADPCDSSDTVSRCSSLQHRQPLQRGDERWLLSCSRSPDLGRKLLSRGSLSN